MVEEIQFDGIDITGKLTELGEIMKNSGADICLILNREPSTSIITPEEDIKETIELKANDTYYFLFKINPDNGKLNLGILFKVEGPETYDLTAAVFMNQNYFGKVIDDFFEAIPSGFKAGRIYLFDDTEVYDYLEKAKEKGITI